MEVLREIYFQDQKRKIYENPNWFSTTTDSVLLCKFVSLKLKDKRILDLGSGVGTIPLLLSLKTSAKIDGIEIQTDVCEFAKKSIMLNQLDNQINIINDDIKNVPFLFKENTFDIVISNPPYFIYQEEKVTNLDIHKKYARHEIAITLEQLLYVAKKVLKDNGRLVLIYRTERLLDMFEILKKIGFEPKRLQFIYHRKKSISKLFLIEATKYGKRELKILPPLFIEEGGTNYAEKL